MVDSGQKLEKKVKKILEESVGSEFEWSEKRYTLLGWAKPMGQKTGEVKTDFLLILEECDSSILKLIKISGKQKNMGAVHNKLTRIWCETIYGSNWESHISNQISSIIEKNGFHKDRIINFEKNIITLGFRHEILYEPDSGREKGFKTNSKIFPAVFWGEGCPTEYRDGKIKNLDDTIKQKLTDANLSYKDNPNIVKNSGIPDYVIKANDTDLNSLSDILCNLQDIKEFSKDYKDELFDAFFAQNYRIDWKAECKHCKEKYRMIWGDVVEDDIIISNNSAKCPYCNKSGKKDASSMPIQGLTRSMVLPVKWSIIDKKLDGVLLLESFHSLTSGDVLINLRNCLRQLKINDDNNFDLKKLKGKVTERTCSPLSKENLRNL